MKFYRYDIGYYNKPTVELTVYNLEKETPKGYWIRWGLDKRWIPKVSRKRFAYPTKEEALQSFIIRKRHHILHTKRTLYFAEETLKIAQKMKNES